MQCGALSLEECRRLVRRFAGWLFDEFSTCLRDLGKITDANAPNRRSALCVTELQTGSGCRDVFQRERRADLKVEAAAPR